MSPGAQARMIPGEILTQDGVVELNPGRARVDLTVQNTGDRPVQVGSHYHFAAANPALAFDRELALDRARGCRRCPVTQRLDERHQLRAELREE